MKTKISIAILSYAILCVGCDNDDDQGLAKELTGRAVVYTLSSGSEYDLDGTITFEEKKDSTLRVSILMTPTGEAVFHPAHLHHGSYSEEAEMAAMLSPVNGETGKSTTELDRLTDGTDFTYDDLEDFDGHVKVHGDDGPNKNLILVFGNVGTNAGEN